MNSSQKNEGMLSGKIVKSPDVPVLNYILQLAYRHDMLSGNGRARKTCPRIQNGLLRVFSQPGGARLPFYPWQATCDSN